MTPEEMVAQQKEQCIFCKMVSGDLPARKVFEDEKVMAILDINPAAKGHVLMMPKEHYPILPVIPFAEMQVMFERSAEVIAAMKKALLVPAVTVFVANGGVAGQQSPHFLFHLIPREPGDMLSAFTVPDQGDAQVNGERTAAILPKFSQLMQAYLHERGRDAFRVEAKPAPPTPEEPSPSERLPDDSGERLDRVIALINENDDLKDALINRPDEVKEAVKTSEKWRALFKGIDVDALSMNLRKVVIANKEGVDPDKVGDGP